MRHGLGWGGKNKNKCRCPVVSLGQFHCRSDNQLDGTRPCLTESTVRYCRQRWVVFRLLFAAPQSSTPTPVQSLSLSLSVSVHDSMLQNLNRRATRAADGWKVCTSQAGGLSHSTTMKCFADHTHAGRVVWFYCSMRAPAARRGWMGHEAASILDTHTHTHRHTHTCTRTRTHGFVVARFIASTKFRDNHRRSGNLVTPPAAKRAPRQNRFHVVIRFAIYFAIPHKRRGHHEEGITHTFLG